jgi:hypothetical protein
VGKPISVFIPQVDKDGNDVGGVHLPQLEVPLATCTGWNLRDPKTGMPNERVSFIGSYLPFPKTKAAATVAGDSRIPITDRYASREQYLKRFSDVASELVADHFILPEDIDSLVRRGGEEWDWVMGQTVR